MKCNGCPNDAKAKCLTCNTCKAAYCCACLEIDVKSSKEQLAALKCPSCSNVTKRRVIDDTPVRSRHASPAPGSTRSPPMTPVPFPDPGADIRAMRRELADYMTEMRECRREMTEFRAAFDRISGRLDGFEKRLEALEKRQPEPADEKVAQLESVVEHLRTELEEREQDALLSDVEVGHMPEVAGESAMQAVSVLAVRLGVTLDERDVVFAERVGPPPTESGRPRRLVVRLARRDLRDRLLAAARVRRTIAAPAGGRIYVNERLTRHNRQLFHRAREQCRDHRWRFCWTRRGRVFIRQGDGKSAIPIRSELDLDRAFKLPPM